MFSHVQDVFILAQHTLCMLILWNKLTTILFILANLSSYATHGRELYLDTNIWDYYGRPTLYKGKQTFVYTSTWYDTRILLLSLYGYPTMTQLHYTTTLASPIFDPLCHDMVRREGSTLYKGIHGSCVVAMCPPSMNFFIKYPNLKHYACLRTLLILLPYQKYLVLDYDIFHHEACQP